MGSDKMLQRSIGVKGSSQGHGELMILATPSYSVQAVGDAGSRAAHGIRVFMLVLVARNVICMYEVLDAIQVIPCAR